MAFLCDLINSTFGFIISLSILFDDFTPLIVPTRYGMLLGALHIPNIFIIDQRVLVNINHRYD